MIVADTSALIAILVNEQEAELFSTIIQNSRRTLVSAGTAVELFAVTSRNEQFFKQAQSFLSESFFVIEPVDKDQVILAADAYRKYGKGFHPAMLNYADVFAYALARQRSLPLLFKGNGFLQTDIEPVRSYVVRYGSPS